jgi:hypothetical protein
MINSFIFMTFLSQNTNDQHLKQFSQNILEYLKEKSVR